MQIQLVINVLKVSLRKVQIDVVFVLKIST